jgi:hypothetical protein
MWVVPFLLGCYHGVNPAMGWLFAVALGMQERSARAVAAAIVPIAVGHLVSVGVVVTLGVWAAAILPANVVRLAAAALLIGFGLFRLARTRHPRWVGMRLGFGGLVLWSFVMASAHGAGLMLLPFVLPAAPASHTTMAMGMSMPMPAQPASGASGILVVAVHTLGYLLVTTIVAVLVYRWLGLNLLRTAWFNQDQIWAFALIAVGLIALAT